MAIYRVVCIGCALLAAPSSAAKPLASVIGTGLSDAPISGPEETHVFSHTVSKRGQWAYLNHFWTAGTGPVDNAIIRYYIDGEKNASIEFTPSLAAGVGFDDETAPWGTKWVGKGAKKTGWFHNIPIPFYKSVRVTAQLPLASSDRVAKLFVIVRGAEGLPLKFENLELPMSDGKVRLDLQRRSATLKPFEFYDMALVEAGKTGAIFMTSLFVKGSTNYNFLEGCFHYYSPPKQAWPGLLLSTGTEDYYDSAFYFNGGGYHMPVSGETHKGGDGTFSAYRFHDMDPLTFEDGVRMQWRNGDKSDRKTGLKCLLPSITVELGDEVSSPGPSTVSSYAWVYTWEPSSEELLA